MIKKFIFLFVFFISVFSFSQETTEDIKLKFQELFFAALTQKAIYNFDEAIDKLDECNELIPNEKSVLFELSKNYAFLNKRFEAIEFANQALVKDPENIWILKHLVAAYIVDRDFDQAIKTQQRIAKNHHKEKQKLVFLHLQNNDKIAAKKLLNELASEKMLNRRLRKIKSSLERSVIKSSKKEVSQINKGTLKDRFEQQKSFLNLKSLLLKLDSENNSDFLKYSEEGLMLFPAQPFVYLMNGKAFNNRKKYKKAISSMENGLDFIIDDKQMESDFYREIIKSYQGLGDVKNVKKYKSKI